MGIIYTCDKCKKILKLTDKYNKAFLYNQQFIFCENCTKEITKDFLGGN